MVNGVQCSDSSSLRAIRRKLQVGSRTLSESFMSSMCVLLVLLNIPNLAAPFQAELAIDTNITVANTHDVVEDAHAMLAGTHTVVADTHTMVSDIHRSVLTERDCISGKTHPVRATCHPLITKCLLYLRLKPGQGYRTL